MQNCMYQLVLTDDNVKLKEQLNEGFKRSVYWNKYRVILDKKDIGANNNPKQVRELLDTSYDGVQRLFLLAYDNTESNNQVSANSFKRYFLPRVKIENCKIEINGINFYDQLVGDLIKQYDEVRKVSTGQGDDSTTGCLLDFAYFKDNYRLIAADLSKQKTLDADLRAIKQIIFTGEVSTNTRICYINQKKQC